MITFNICGFSDIGTERKKNEDALLINGFTGTDTVFKALDTNYCIAFVADGVGGNKGGAYASNYVLKVIFDSNEETLDGLKENIYEKNRHFIGQTIADHERQGAATTLTGLILNNGSFNIIHAGDSQIWLLRNDIFFKVTNDMVLNPYLKNSPITSYFGGTSDNLTFDADFNVSDYLSGDVFVICTDGLMASLSPKKVKEILKFETDSYDKISILQKTALEYGAPDNVTAIIVECIETHESHD